MPIPSAEEFALELIKEFHSRANPKSETHRTIGQRIARMIQERDEAIRESAYQSGIDVGFESGYECGSNNIEVG